MRNDYQIELLIHSLSELLAVAKVAMPDAIFDQDPRVYRAQQLLAQLSEGAQNGPTISFLHGVIPSGEQRPWDISAGLDAFMSSDQAPPTRTEAVVLILREWLTANGYLALLPEDAN